MISQQYACLWCRYKSVVMKSKSLGYMSRRERREKMDEW
jgi:hypothetical protein